MSRFAKVISVDAVQRLAGAVDSFKEEATAATDNLELEVRRALDWIVHDRKDFWDTEVRRGWDRVAEARLELERRLTYGRVGEHQPACREEKLALEKAKRRLRVAEEKVELVRRWRHKVEHELTEYVGALNQLTSWLQADHPRAMAELKRMIDALDAYVAAGTSAESAGAAPGSPAAGDDLSAERPPETPSDRTEETSPELRIHEDMGPEHGSRESGGRDEDAPGRQVRDGGALGR